MLMLGLPHHIDLLGSGGEGAKGKQLRGVLGGGYRYETVKGVLAPVLGSEGGMVEDTLPPVSFLGGERGWLEGGGAEGVKRFILRQAVKDLVSSPKVFTRDVYGFGKEISRVANLALLFYELEGPASPSLGKALAILSAELSVWFSGENSDRLVYDTTIHGIVTTDGVSDSGKDFGNGWYNDQ